MEKLQQLRKSIGKLDKRKKFSTEAKTHLGSFRKVPQRKLYRTERRRMNIKETRCLSGNSTSSTTLFSNKL